MKKSQWSFFRIKHAVLCFFGNHVWQRPMFFRLNSLPGEEDFECHFCGKHKTFFNRKKTIMVKQNASDDRPRSGTVDPVVGCPECAKMSEYIRDHVHSFIDSDEINRLMSFEEWCALDAPNTPRTLRASAPPR